MSSVFILFPINLFKTPQLPLIKEKDVTHYLIEEPVFFGDRDTKMNFNRIKLVLHRASMQNYFHTILKKADKNSQYVEYTKLKGDSKYKFLDDQAFTEIHCFDPVDRYLVEKLKSMAKKHGVEFIMHENPNFLTPMEDTKKYAKGRKSYHHHNFYEWQKERMDILVGVSSKDKDNRKPPPKKIKVPPMPKNPDLNSKYVKEAIKYIDKHFPKNYGSSEDMIYPITHETSEKWFKHFLTNRFDQFGAYQDAMVPNEPFMYHSVITPMLNIGLLDPQWIIDQCTKFYKDKKIAINNYEGYVRQVIGWREYSRMLYMVYYKPIKNGNYFGHKGKLNAKWYDGTTGFEPIDHTIKMAFKYGYLHHILRLMMMSNFMNLCHLHPHQVFQWMMEFSADSYDWVMTNNVYSMGLFADGGLTMRKPYLSTSNYILKMSKFKKDGVWDIGWTRLYHYFLYSKEKELRKTTMARNLGIWDRKTSKEKAEIKKEATEILKFLTD